MKKILTFLMLSAFLAGPVFAAAPTEGRPGKISGRSVGAAAVSLILWPVTLRIILLQRLQMVNSKRKRKDIIINQRIMGLIFQLRMMGYSQQ